MKPTDDLINEHRAIKIMLGIMQKIAAEIQKQKEPDLNDTGNIINFLKTFADKCHHGKEENVLFPALVEAGVPDENGPVGVMLHEHTLGRGFIKDMESAAESYKAGNRSSSALIADSMTNYVNLLTNHILKEENVLFRMADKLLSATIQEKILDNFEEIEEEVVGHGVHEQFHELLDKLRSKYLVK